MILKGEARRAMQLLSDRNEWCGKDLSERDKEIHPHNIYVTLSRLEKQGLVEHRWEQREGTRGFGVKLFWMTDVGAQVLRATQAVEHERLKDARSQPRGRTAEPLNGRS